MNEFIRNNYLSMWIVHKSMQLKCRTKYIWLKWKRQTFHKRPLRDALYLVISNESHKIQKKKWIKTNCKVLDSSIVIIRKKARFVRELEQCHSNCWKNWHLVPIVGSWICSILRIQMIWKCLRDWINTWIILKWKKKLNC